MLAAQIRALQRAPSQQAQCTLPRRGLSGHWHRNLVVDWRWTEFSKINSDRIPNTSVIMFSGDSGHLSRRLSGPISRDIAILSLIPHIAWYFLREVCAPPKWCDTPPWYLVSDRHICAIPHFATYRAIIVRYPTKRSTKLFCDTIATSIARYEKYRCWASKPDACGDSSTCYHASKSLSCPTNLPVKTEHCSKTHVGRLQIFARSSHLRPKEHILIPTQSHVSFRHSHTPLRNSAGNGWKVKGLLHAAMGHAMHKEKVRNADMKILLHKMRVGGHAVTGCIHTTDKRYNRNYPSNIPSTHHLFWE